MPSTSTAAPVPILLAPVAWRGPVRAGDHGLCGRGDAAGDVGPGVDPRGLAQAAIRRRHPAS